MVELLKTIGVVGLRRMLRLSRAYRLGWRDTISGFHTTRTMQALFNVGLFGEMQEKGTANVDSFAELVGQTITEKTRSIWYPKTEQLDLTSEAYVDES